MAMIFVSIYFYQKKTKSIHKNNQQSRPLFNTTQTGFEIMICSQLFDPLIAVQFVRTNHRIQILKYFTTYNYIFINFSRIDPFRNG